MTALLVEVTPDGLVRRREELIASLSCSEDELYQRAADHSASPGELDVYTELEEISFLLGESA